MAVGIDRYAEPAAFAWGQGQAARPIKTETYKEGGARPKKQKDLGLKYV